MDKSEKRFERDIESFLISTEGGYVQLARPGWELGAYTPA